MEYWLTNGFLVNEGRCFRGSLLIRDGYIAEIFEEAAGEPFHNPENTTGNTRATIDLNGAYVFPGVIDPHVHFREPGLTHKGDIASESTAALLGGVTSIMEMPNTKPPTLTQALLEEKFALAAEHCRVNYSFYMGCSRDNLEEVLKTDPEKVCGIKLFMGSSTGNMLVNDADYLEALFAHAPTLIAAHCEDEALISRNTALFREKYGEDAPFSVHPKIRSEEACFKASSRAAELAHKYGTRLHIMHISTGKELTLLDDDKITGEVCPSYLWFTDKDYARYGAKIKCNPAIKTASDREALREAVRQGRVTIGTDHAPHTWEEKQQSYFKCPSGVPWIQYSLSMMLELAYQGVFSIPQIVEAICHKPANLYRIDRRGFLRKGYHADLAVVNPAQAFTVRKENIAYKCGWSPLEDQTLHGAVTATFVNGVLIQNGGVILDSDFRGDRLLFR